MESSTPILKVGDALTRWIDLLCLLLPHTPPKKVGADVSVGEILGLDALALLKKRSFAVFIGCMFLICIPLYFYFVNMAVYLTEVEWPNFAARMTLAQVSDVIFLFFRKVADMILVIILGVRIRCIHVFCDEETYHFLNGQTFFNLFF